MQEHIRRAHPEHYISKLPATEESFQLMINTPPSEKPPPTSSNAAPHGPYITPQKVNRDGLTIVGYGHEHHNYYGDDSSAPNTPRNLDEYHSASMLPAASAAAALAQLHNHKMEPEWDSEIEWLSDTEPHEPHIKAMRASVELPSIKRSNHTEPTSEPFPAYTTNGVNSGRIRDSLFPPIMSTSPPGRSSTLPPLQRHGSARPRKQSVSKRAREPQHRRQQSKEQAHMRKMSYDRKAYSAEPSSGFAAAYGKRWEDLIDAATSATEDVEDDRTPMPQSPQIPHSPLNRSSMPPFSASHFQGYQASPLQQALTPPSYPHEVPEPFPSVESGENGDNFHIESHGLSDSSPSFSSQNIQIYCAACQGVSQLKESYACTECICGLCQACVDVLMAEQGARRKCPRCATIGGRFKPFQLDIR
ncbi:MAG: hypothetical protein M1818_001602 [Claussenomyces sp. TS43310]|nr:MAG: hypothetical protein M1818_001602 [Claussenomyces sp. TS43310]